MQECNTQSKPLGAPGLRQYQLRSGKANGSDVEIMGKWWEYDGKVWDIMNEWEITTPYHTVSYVHEQSGQDFIPTY